MQFRVLAALDVHSADGRSAPVPETKVRALLAALLAHRGRPVSTARLVEHIWGPRPPAHPTASLQSKVSQLRRALDNAEPGARTLVTAAPLGYRLDVSADALDSGRFTALTTRAYASTTPRERAELLGAALELWHGPAFAGFADHDLIRPVAESLEEQRLTALEEGDPGTVGRFDSAARLLGAAAALRTAAGAPQPAAERGDVARSTVAARRGLGDATFDAEYARGRGWHRRCWWRRCRR